MIESKLIRDKFCEVNKQKAITYLKEVLKNLKNSTPETIDMDSSCAWYLCSLAVNRFAEIMKASGVEQKRIES